MPASATFPKHMPVALATRHTRALAYTISSGKLTLLSSYLLPPVSGACESCMPYNYAAAVHNREKVPRYS
jgi:hypothetical protein